MDLWKLFICIISLEHQTQYRLIQAATLMCHSPPGSFPALLTEADYDWIRDHRKPALSRWATDSPNIIMCVWSSMFCAMALEHLSKNWGTCCSESTVIAFFPLFLVPATDKLLSCSRHFHSRSVLLRFLLLLSTSCSCLRLVHCCWIKMIIAYAGFSDGVTLPYTCSWIPIH